MKKALISPVEIFNHTYVSGWKTEEGSIIPIEIYTTIENCYRVAEVAETTFEVAEPLFWTDCPDDCKADLWYYKDGVFYAKPTDVPQPAAETPVQQMP